MKNLCNIETNDEIRSRERDRKKSFERVPQTSSLGIPMQDNLS
jgi:hypothetical protein